jgi:hypothetical protein
MQVTTSSEIEPLIPAAMPFDLEPDKRLNPAIAGGDIVSSPQRKRP